jgi:hypothetical protein
LELGVQALIWFGAAGGAGAFGLSLLWTRYVRKEANAVQAGGGHVLFAVCTLLFALGALIAGLASAGVGS